MNLFEYRFVNITQATDNQTPICNSVKKSEQKLIIILKKNLFQSVFK